MFLTYEYLLTIFRRDTEAREGNPGGQSTVESPHYEFHLGEYPH